MVFGAHSLSLTAATVAVLLTLVGELGGAGDCCACRTSVALLCCVCAMKAPRPTPLGAAALVCGSHQLPVGVAPSVLGTDSAVLAADHTRLNRAVAAVVRAAPLTGPE